MRVSVPYTGLARGETVLVSSYLLFSSCALPAWTLDFGVCLFFGVVV